MSEAVATQPAKVKGAGLWLTAQLIALLATVVVIVGFFVEPKTLDLVWKLIIPLVPASLLVSPMLWRNVCPLATLNKIPGRKAEGKGIGAGGLVGLSVLGMILLFVLVTARHVLYNGFNPTDGVTMGVTVAAVAAAALLLGLVFDRKIGFCNSFCPVLPVERLYGQSPLLEVNHPRCPDCNQCTHTGCIDLGPEVSIPQVLGKSRDTSAWVLTPYGIFAAAFPGFVLGYFLASDGPLDTAPTVFLEVGKWTLISFLAVAILVTLLRAKAKYVMPLLGAAAVGLYYWFSGPIISGVLGLNPDDLAAGEASTTAIAIRAVTFALTAWWLVSAYARLGRKPATPEAA